LETTVRRYALLRELAEGLGIVCWTAEAESAAECMRLEALQLVDAVWSEDGLALIYGATMVVLETKEERLECRDKFRVHRNRDGRCMGRNRLRLIACAALVGGHHGETYLVGVPGCTPAIANSLLMWRRSAISKRSWTNMNPGAIASRRFLLDGALYECAPYLRLPESFHTRDTAIKLDDSRTSHPCHIKRYLESDLYWER